jgi:glycopeptide antibiotics resistance protein
LFSLNSTFLFFISLAAWIGFRLLANKKAGVFWPREIILNLFYLYGWVVFLLTLAPLDIVLFDFDFSGANLVPFVETLRFLKFLDAPGVKQNLLGNFLLLAPLGIFLPILYRRYRRLGAVIGTGFLVTLGIEAAQLLLRFRVFDIDDLILNVLGVFLTFVLFSLFLLVPGLRRAVDRITNRPQIGTSGYYKGFIGVVVIVFAGLFITGYLENAHTQEQIVETLPSQGQRLVTQVNYGGYLIILSEARDGSQNMAEYRQVPFDRYAPISGIGGLELNENEFVVTGGWLVGESIDYFVMARSSKPVAVMQAADEQYSVMSDGEYHFSVGRFPHNTNVRFLEFRFLDSAGSDLGFTPYAQY